MNKYEVSMAVTYTFYVVADSVSDAEEKAFYTYPKYPYNAIVDDIEVVEVVEDSEE